MHYNYAVTVVPSPGKYNVSQSTFTEEFQVQGRALEDQVPRTVGRWVSQDVGDP